MDIIIGTCRLTSRKVRAAVRNYDVDLPVNTIRAWVIGMVLCTAGSAINMLFSLRNPSVSINTYVIQLIAYPIGVGWDLIFPDKEVRQSTLHARLTFYFARTTHVLIPKEGNCLYIAI